MDFSSYTFKFLSNIDIIMPMVFKLNEVNNKISVGSDDRLHINRDEKRFGLIPFSSGFHVHCPVQVERTMYAPKRYHNQDGLIMLSSLPFTGFMCRFVHVVQCTTYTCSEFVLEVAGLCQHKYRFSSPIYCCYYCCGCFHHNNIKLPLLVLLLLFPWRHYFHVMSSTI